MQQNLQVNPLAAVVRSSADQIRDQEYQKFLAKKQEEAREEAKHKAPFRLFDADGNPSKELLEQFEVIGLFELAMLFEEKKGKRRSQKVLQRAYKVLKKNKTFTPWQQQVIDKYGNKRGAFHQHEEAMRAYEAVLL